MATYSVQQMLEKRRDFIQHLKNLVAKNERTIASVTSTINDLQATSANVKELGKKVEHSALIPLGKKIYLNGCIVHTGEYFLDKLAFPQSYTIKGTLDKTLKNLDEKIKQESEQLKNCETARQQLKDRIRLLEGDESDARMLEEIMSERGIALRVGDSYEIIEYEN